MGNALQYNLLSDPIDGRSTGDLAVESFRIGPGGMQVSRQATLRNGETVISTVAMNELGRRDDLHGAFDAAWLRSRIRPIHETHRGTARLVDLFSGCGALSLGITEACRAIGLEVEHAFAADINPLALDVYARNFPTKHLSCEPIESLVGKIGAPISFAERKLSDTLGAIDILAGGPPCQGHSDLNNHTRRKDPRNALFETMIRFAQVLQPKHVIIENVPGIQHDRRKVTELGRRVLESMGYAVAEAVLVASEYGAAQRRRRYFMVATSNSAFRFSNLGRVSEERTFRWACEDLIHRPPTAIIDSHASSSRENRERIDYLFEHGLYDLPNEYRPQCHRLKKHSYNAVYGRLKWDEPAPTITSGFNSPGQGRFIHPEVPRTLTPHEAARVQFLPDFFDWGRANREGLTQMIGNAVPPKLAYAVALEMLR